VGCSSLPNVADYGEAVSNASTLYTATVNANRTLALRIGEEVEAEKFLSGKAFALGDKPSGLLNAVRTKVRLDALSALKAYGDGLKLAADQGQIDKLEAAAVKVGQTASTILTGIAPPSIVLAPAITLGARGFGYALSSAYVYEIRQIIKARNDDVQTLVGALKADIGLIASVIEQQAADFAQTRRTNLVFIRDSGQVDKLRLYQEYRVARQDVIAANALVGAAANHVRILDAIAKAHNQLAEDDIDAALTIRRLITLIDNFIVLVDAVKKAER
jgi:hypothetical protein